jgi:5-methylcytosine-specific restriction endonuclease McrA
MSDLVWVQRSNYHFQVIGKYLVNYYPTKNTYYIQGTERKGLYRDEKHLEQIANGQCEINIGYGEKRKGTSRPKKKKLWEKGVRNCFVCGQVIATFNEATLEHKVPLSIGGSNRMDNLSLSHKECNHKKGNKL